MNYIEGDDPHDVWIRLIKLISSNYDNFETEDKIIYPYPLVSIIEHPTTMIKKNPLYSQNFIDIYAAKILDEDKGGFVYTYGERLNGYRVGEQKLVINQIEQAIHRLEDDDTSRRACCVIWNPYVDVYIDDCPCMQWVKFYIRNDKLHMQVLFRSHDITKGYYANVLMLSYLMKYVASRLVKRVGSLTVISSDAHLYKTDSDLVKKLISEDEKDKLSNWNRYRNISMGLNIK